MVIETQYELGDEVFFLHQNKIRNGILDNIIIRASLNYGLKPHPEGKKEMVTDKENKKITYTVYYEIGEIQVKQLFKTKEELIKSL